MASQPSFKILLPTCLLLLICVNSFSQKQAAGIKDSFPFPRFEKITTRQGLSDNEVYKMTQDKMGFLWFLTYNGLNRYDGYTFKTYDYNQHDSNSITAGYFYTLVQDQKGLLWMNSENDGIYSFDPLTEKFFHYRHHAGDKNSLIDDRTTGLVIDKPGNVWVATQSGLDKLERQTNKFIHITQRQYLRTNLSNNFISTITIDEDDNLWLVTSARGLDYFNTRTAKLIQHFNFGSSIDPVEDWDILHPYGANTGRNGNIWIGSRTNGLYCYNTRSRRTTHFIHEKKNIYSISSNGVYKILEDSNGNLWLATDAGIIDFYEKSSGKFYHWPVPAMGHIDMLEDQSHKIWIATMNGIYSCDTRFKKINSILLDVNNYSFNDNSPWYFLRTRKGTMYVAYEGIRVFDTATKTLTPFPIYENGKNIFENSIAFQIYEDTKDNLWFATIRGLIFYNPVTKQHHWYQHKEDDSTSLSASSCTRIIEDRSGRFWINTWNGGLDAFDPATGKFRQYKANGSTNSISSDNLAGSFMASNGTLYIGSLSGGVILFDLEKEIFTIYRHNVHDPFSVSCDLAFGYKESKSGIIWFCTLGGGVNAFDPQTKKFRAFTTKEGLLSNSVVSLVEDDNGNFWLGTNKGISCFTPPENPFNPLSKFSFRNYDISDGLPDNKMNLMAAYKDVDGKIYFGSTDGGIVYFDPKTLKDNEYLPPVYLTDVKVFNKSVHPYDGDSILKSPIELTKEITLSYNQNDISFEFAALNYFHPEKNQYLYKLEPYNRDWIATDASKRFANYTNLNAGKYTFEVKASNNDGVWNETPATIKLIIRPPFWQTGWFRALMVVALIATAYGFFWYRMQHILRLQRIRNRIASDLHDDIGSTLNSISVYSEVAKNDSAKRDFSLNMIGESSRKVIDAMSDIVWTINPDNDSFEKIILRMRSLSYNLFRAKKIEFSFRADESLHGLKLSLEKRRNFYLIFKETINNLLKYSQAGRASVLLTHHSTTIALVVRDDGIGFDPTKKYNGNGLINMNRRAEEINAQLDIQSGEGIGTTVQLIFKA